MKTARLAVVLGFVFFGCGSREPAVVPLEADELPHYAYRLPDDYDPQDSYPLVVVLHGEGRDETEPLSYWDRGAFVRPDFILVAVRAPFRRGAGFFWFPQPVEGYEKQAAALTGEVRILDIIADCEQFGVDPDWRFLVGFGEAGNVALYTAVRHPEVFQGVAALGEPVDTAVVRPRMVRSIGDIDVFLTADQDDRAQRDARLFEKAGARVILYPQSAPSADMCRAVQEFFGLLDTVSGLGGLE